MSEKDWESVAARRHPRADYTTFQRAFPKLYPQDGPRCGWALPLGWAHIVWNLSETLEPLGVVCDQVKEKFGTLCFYLVDYAQGEERDALVRIINAAQDESARVCQVCGSRAAKSCTIGMWVVTLCAHHEAERRAWKEGL
jgi:hypothetical protein